MATLLFQFDRFAVPISQVDIFRLVPRWTFFSPNPGHHDLHLMFRDRYNDGQLSDWAEVVLPNSRTAIPGLWNPEKRLAKVLWDAWLSIQYLTSEEKVPAEHLPLSGAYLVLFNLAQRAKKVGAPIERQFSLVRSTGFENRTPEPLFVSLFHRLPVRASDTPA